MHSSRCSSFSLSAQSLLIALTLLLAANVVHAEAPPNEDQQQSAEDESFVDKVNPYYSLVLDDNLEPEVDDKVTALWVTSVFCGPLCGSLWIPMLWVGEDPGSEYFFKEALILIGLELLTYVTGAATTPVAGIGAVLITANLVYLTPIGIINGYDRALKKQRGKPYPGSEPSDDVKKTAAIPMAHDFAMAY